MYFLNKLRFAINYLGPFSSIFWILIFTPLYLSYFGKDQWSVIGIMSLLQPLSYIFLFGAGHLITREIVKIKNKFYSEKIYKSYLDLQNKLFLKSVALFFILLVVLTIFKNFKYDFDYSLLTLTILSLIISIKIIEIYYFATLTGLKDFYYFNILQSLFAFLKWGGSYIIIIIFNLQILEFLYIYFFLSIIQSILLKKRINFLLGEIKIPVKKYSFSMKFSYDIAFISIFILILFQFDKFIFLTSFTKETLSAYSIAFLLASGLPNFILPMIGFFTPIMNTYFEEKSYSSLDNLNIKISIINYFFSISSFLIILLIGKKILNLWLDDLKFVEKVFSYFIPLSAIYLNYNLLTQLQVFYIANKSLNILKFSFTILMIILILSSIVCYIYFSFIIFLYTVGILISMLSLSLSVKSYQILRK